MKLVAPILSWLALAVLVIAPVMYLINGENLDGVKLAMFLATILWFIAGTVWLWNKK